MESVKVFTTRKRCCGQVIVKGLTICSLLARLESAYSLIWGSHNFGERVVGTPWHFYDK